MFFVIDRDNVSSDDDNENDGDAVASAVVDDEVK